MQLLKLKKFLSNVHFHQLTIQIWNWKDIYYTNDLHHEYINAQSYNLFVYIYGMIL